MKTKVIIITTLVMCLLCGCNDNNGNKYPRIQETGETDWVFDDVNIQVYNAKRGLKGYEIIENENGIDVIFHYEKEQK